MNQSELNEILRKHNLWVEGIEGGKYANLRGANLRDADLRYSNCQGADFRDTDLRYADLRYSDFRDANCQDTDFGGANIDFSCLPLWCGSLKAKWDKKHIIQFLYHAVAPCYWHPEIIEDDEDLKELMQNPLLIKVCNKFHRLDCPRIEKIKEESNV